MNIVYYFSNTVPGSDDRRQEFRFVPFFVGETLLQWYNIYLNIAQLDCELGMGGVGCIFIG